MTTNINELLERQKALSAELDKVEKEIHEEMKKHRNARVDELCKLMRIIYAEGVNTIIEINDDDDGTVFIDLDDLADEIECNLKWKT